MPICGLAQLLRCHAQIEKQPIPASIGYDELLDFS